MSGQLDDNVSPFYSQPEYYKDAPHFRRVGDGPEYRLEIPAAKFDYTGTYSMIATNCHGEAKAIISLQIHAKGIYNNWTAFHQPYVHKWRNSGHLWDQY